MYFKIAYIFSSSKLDRQIGQTLQVEKLFVGILELVQNLVFFEQTLHRGWAWWQDFFNFSSSESYSQRLTGCGGFRKTNIVSFRWNLIFGVFYVLGELKKPHGGKNRKKEFWNSKKLKFQNLGWLELTNRWFEKFICTFGRRWMTLSSRWSRWCMLWS